VISSVEMRNTMKPAQSASWPLLPMCKTNGTGPGQRIVGGGWPWPGMECGEGKAVEVAIRLLSGEVTSARPTAADRGLGQLYISLEGDEHE